MATECAGDQKYKTINTARPPPARRPNFAPAFMFKSRKLGITAPIPPPASASTIRRISNRWASRVLPVTASARITDTKIPQKQKRAKYQGGVRRFAQRRTFSSASLPTPPKGGSGGYRKVHRISCKGPCPRHARNCSKKALVQKLRRISGKLLAPARSRGYASRIL